jgi:hypothetical protein
LRAEAQVARQGEPEAAADAEALDGGNGRFRKTIDGRIEPLGGGIVDLHRFAGRALVRELGDIGARDERLAAGARQHHDAHILILAASRPGCARRLPHLQRDGVVALGIVEDHGADAAILAREHLVGGGHGCRSGGWN